MALHTRHHRSPVTGQCCSVRAHPGVTVRGAASTASSPFSFSLLPSGTVPRPAAMATRWVVVVGRRQGRWAGAIPHSLPCFCVADTTGANRGQSPSPVAAESAEGLR